MKVAHKVEITATARRNAKPLVESHRVAEVIQTAKNAANDALGFAGKPVVTKAKLVKPYTRWMGNKYKIAREILALAPANATRYIEPFLGSGAVALVASERFDDMNLFDANGGLILTHRHAVKSPRRLIRDVTALNTPENNTPEAYRRLRDEFNNGCTPDRTAALFVYLNTACRGGMYRCNASGEMNSSFGKRSSLRVPGKAIAEFSKRLAKAKFKKRDFRVAMKEAGPGTFMYCDVPYLNTFDDYTPEGFQMDSHLDSVRLAKEAARRGATVVFSNMDSPEVRELYCDADEIIAIDVKRRFAEDGIAKELLAVYRPSSSMIGQPLPQQEAREAEKVAANQPAFAATAEGFNKHGIAAAPVYSETFTTDKGNADASLFAHPLGEQWVSGFAYDIRTGSGNADGKKPDMRSARFDSLNEAVADSAQRISAIVAAKYPDLNAVGPTEHKAVTALLEWAKRQHSRAVRGEIKDPRPLLGLRYASFFSGVGGFELALNQLGARCVFACEIDKHARKAYAANFDTSKHVLAEDITKVRAEDVPAFDIIVGGFPCQAFSIAGKKQAFDDEKGRGRLFFDMTRIIDAHKPAMAVFENVPQFMKLDGGIYAREAQMTLMNMGYTVSRRVLSAAEFGLPQLRERVFFVATRNDIMIDGDAFIFPNGNGTRLTVADILESNAPTGHISPSRVVPDATKDKKRPTQRVGRIDGHNRQDSVVMSPNGVGLTILATQRNSGLYMVNGRPRALTVRERARMQGFPESYVFPCSENQSCKQLGNSVAVPVVAAVMRAAANQIFKQTA